MGKNKKRLNTREIAEAMEDGTVERQPSASWSPGCDPGDRWQEDDNIKPANPSKYPSHRGTVSSQYRDGQVVTCPDRSKGAESDPLLRTSGTITQLMGNEALVLGQDGHMHRCFISELSPV